MGNVSRAEVVSRRLKLRQLEVLLAVAEAGSMAKAAARLAITQPVVSKSIADLENTLALRLLDRTAQGVELTMYGRALLERSIAMFNDLRMSVNELECLADPATGDLRIGSSETVAAGMLGIIIDRLSRQYPRLTFEVTLGGDLTDLPHRDLRSRNIDLIIGRLPPVIPDDMESITLFQDWLYIVGSSRNPLTRRREVKLSELVDEPWCGAPFDSFPWSLVRDAFRAQKLEVPRNVVRTRSILARNRLLSTGRFLTLLPRSMLQFAVNSPALKRVPVALPLTKYPVGIVSLKDRTPTPVARLFADCARQVAEPLARNQ